jgi:hypothetical protein
MWRAPSEQQALNPVTCVVTYLTSFFFGDTGVSGDWFGFSVALFKKKKKKCTVLKMHVSPLICAVWPLRDWIPSNVQFENESEKNGTD